MTASRHPLPVAPVLPIPDAELGTAATPGTPGVAGAHEALGSCSVPGSRSMAAGHGAVESGTLRTADGVLLWAELWRRGCVAGEGPQPAPPSPVVVLAHGFSAGADDHRVRALAGALYGAGWDVLRYDARGHGRSGGRCSVGAREDLDVAAAADQAAAGGGPVVLLGVSMGAVAVAGYLAGLAGLPAPAVAGAVLVSGPARWRMRPHPIGLLSAGMTRTGIGRCLAARHLGVRIAADWRPGEPPEACLRRAVVPVAVVHGEGDRLLATGHARRLAAAATDSRLRVVAGMGHGIDEAAVPEVIDQVRWVLARAHLSVAIPPIGA